MVKAKKKVKSSEKSEFRVITARLDEDRFEKLQKYLDKEKLGITDWIRRQIDDL